MTDNITYVYYLFPEIYKKVTEVTESIESSVPESDMSRVNMVLSQIEDLCNLIKEIETHLTQTEEYMNGVLIKAKKQRSQIKELLKSLD